MSNNNSNNSQEMMSKFRRKNSIPFNRITNVLAFDQRDETADKLNCSNNNEQQLCQIDLNTFETSTGAEQNTIKQQATYKTAFEDLTNKNQKLTKKLELLRIENEIKTTKIYKLLMENKEKTQLLNEKANGIAFLKKEIKKLTLKPIQFEQSCPQTTKKRVSSLFLSLKFLLY
jgi:hypothetical protein